MSEVWICQSYSSNVYVIGTLKTQSLDWDIRGSNPIFSSSIKTINLNNTSQPACGLLSRFIKREYRTDDFEHENNDFLEFLPKFLVKLNRMIEEISGSSCATIGAGIFISEIFNQDDSETEVFQENFVRIWNGKIKNYVDKVLSQRKSYRKEWSDLLSFENSGLETQIISRLDKILIDDDVITEDKSEPQFSISKLLDDDDEDDFILDAKHCESADPLADMLTKLQDAVKGTNCYDSESEESSIGCYTASPTTKEFVNFSLDDVNF